MLLQEEVEALRVYQKKARFVMSKLHREINELKLINADLQARLRATEIKLEVYARTRK